MPTLKDQARADLYQALKQSGWKFQDARSANLNAIPDVSLRNFPPANGYGLAGNLLYFNGKATGLIQAKNKGVTKTRYTNSLNLKPSSRNTFSFNRSVASASYFPQRGDVPPELRSASLAAQGIATLRQDVFIGAICHILS